MRIEAPIVAWTPPSTSRASRCETKATRSGASIMSSSGVKPRPSSGSRPSIGSRFAVTRSGAHTQRPSAVVERQRGLLLAPRGNLVERGNGVVQVGVVGKRDIPAVGASGRHLVVDANQPARIREGQRSQQRVVDEGEDCRVGADPERQRDDGGDGQRRGHAQAASGVSGIMKNAQYRRDNRVPATAGAIGTAERRASRIGTESVLKSPRHLASIPSPRGNRVGLGARRELLVDVAEQELALRGRNQARQQ